MELATAQGFDVRVVTLPPGQDPADAPRASRSASARPRATSHYRVRLEIERAADRQEAFVRAARCWRGAEDSPERQEAVRFLADRLDLPRRRSGPASFRARAPAPASCRSKVLEAGDRLERDALAGVRRALRALPALAECRPTTSTPS